MKILGKTTSAINVSAGLVRQRPNVIEKIGAVKKEKPSPAD
jgi:hypothetical protein